MARLKKLKFEDSEHILEYYEDNKDEIFERTYKLLREFWDKNRFIDNVDIYETEVKTFEEMKYISVLSKEWDLCLYDMMIYYVKTEQYLQAEKIKKFIKEIFGQVKEI
jgi:long-subunit acyl-CoA synthetase (AMP-forming)